MRVTSLAGVLLWLTLAGMGCVDPQPQTLTLPSAADKEREVRKAMVEFNEARFKAECAAIDSALLGASRIAKPLAGGVRCRRIPKTEAKGLEGWRAAAGEFVVWDWEAWSLDGEQLASGRDEFQVDKGAVPRAFHEAAKQLGHHEKAEVWAPSVSAFGVRGLPGEVPPFTPVKIRVYQTRYIQDTAWVGGMLRGHWAETPWVEALLASNDNVATPMGPDAGVWTQVHDTRSEPLRSGQSVLLRIRTTMLTGPFERETQMEWTVGTQDQIVPAIEQAILSHPQANTMTVWSTSAQAFGVEGSPKAGIPAHAPLRFDLEVLPQ